MPSVPVPPEGGLRNARLHAVAGGAAIDAEAILRGAPAKNAYDPDKWYGAAYNEHDHAQELRLRIHPDVARAMTNALQNDILKAVGIRTPTAFFRAALVDAMHKLYQQTGDGDLFDTMQREIVRHSIGEINAERENAKTMLAEFDKLASDAIADSDWNALAHAVELMESVVGSFRDPFLTQLQRQIAYYASRIPTQS